MACRFGEGYRCRRPEHGQNGLPAAVPARQTPAETWAAKQVAPLGETALKPVLLLMSDVRQELDGWISDTLAWTTQHAPDPWLAHLHWVGSGSWQQNLECWPGPFYMSTVFCQVHSLCKVYNDTSAEMAERT